MNDNFSFSDGKSILAISDEQHYILSRIIQGWSWTENISLHMLILRLSVLPGFNDLVQALGTLKMT